MMYKNAFEARKIKTGDMDANMVDADTIELTVGIQKDVAVNTYVTSIVKNDGHGECVMMLQLTEDADTFEKFIDDPAVMNEIRAKWPVLYSMINAGRNDVYTDAAVIVLNGCAFIAVMFDQKRMKKRDAREYVAQKVAHIVEKCMAVCEEMENKELNTMAMKMNRFVRTVSECVKGARRGRMIGKVLGWFLFG